MKRYLTTVFVMGLVFIPTGAFGMPSPLNFFFAEGKSEFKQSPASKYKEQAWIAGSMGAGSGLVALMSFSKIGHLNRKLDALKAEDDGSLEIEEAMDSVRSSLWWWRQIRKVSLVGTGLGALYAVNRGRKAGWVNNEVGKKDEFVDQRLYDYPDFVSYLRGPKADEASELKEKKEEGGEKGNRRYSRKLEFIDDSQSKLKNVLYSNAPDKRKMKVREQLAGEYVETFRSRRAREVLVRESKAHLYENDYERINQSFGEADLQNLFEALKNAQVITDDVNIKLAEQALTEGVEYINKIVVDALDTADHAMTAREKRARYVVAKSLNVSMLLYVDGYASDEQKAKLNKTIASTELLLAELAEALGYDPENPPLITRSLEGLNEYLELQGMFAGVGLLLAVAL